MHRVTVVIPTVGDARWDMMCRARESAEVQDCDVLVVECEGNTVYGGEFHITIPDNGAGPTVLPWYVGAQMASTPYVAILFDDDWYEPAFIERSLELLDKGAHFTFSQATVHYPDGHTDINIKGGADQPLVSGASVLDVLRRMDATISPGCCVFKRETILEHLCVSRIPGLRTARTLVGPDKLLLMMAAHEADANGGVGFIQDPLVNFSAHEDSTTIKAARNEDARNQLLADYAAVVRYFDLVTKG